MLPLIVKHVLNNDGLRILGNKRPVADAKWEGHLWMQETGPIANNGLCACQQRDTDCFTLKSDGHGLENGICVQKDSVNCRRNDASEQNTYTKVAYQY